MLRVTNLTIKQQYGGEFLCIDFEIANTNEKLSDYQFDILRGSAETDDFITVASAITDFTFKDYSVNLLNPTIEYYYKIRIIDKITGEFVDSDVKRLFTSYTDNYANYLVNINNYYLDNVIMNDKAYLLKRKRFGEYCECYDDVREKSRKQNCPICFGTKFDGGYYPPSEISINFYNSPTATESFSHTGSYQEETPVQLWTSAFPQIVQGDIIVLSNNTRHRVMTCNDSQMRGMITRQVIQVQRIPETDVVYKYKI